MAKKTFEQSLARLEEIVRTLEQGQSTLADSLKLFEEGTTLVRSCETMLSEAEQKVVQLRARADGTPDELPFEGA